MRQANRKIYNFRMNYNKREIYLMIVKIEWRQTDKILKHSGFCIDNVDRGGIHRIAIVM